MKSFIILVLTFYSSIILAQNFNYLNLEDDDDFSDLRVLEDEIEKYNFYFSGENHMFSTSNSQLEFKLLKYLHQKQGVKNLVLEFGEGTGFIVNNYVLSTKDNVGAIMKNQFHEDYFDFFEKIKNYNKTLDSANKIQVTGLDLQRSYYLGVEALYLQLPPDTITPPDSIAREIELIRFLKGYVEDRAEKNIFESSRGNWGYSKSYSISNALATLEKNFQAFEEEYKAYLKDDFENYKLIFNCLLKAKKFKVYQSERNPYASMYREDYMFKKLIKTVAEKPNEKFYGQFGRAHISNQRASYEKYGTYNFASLVSKINKSKKPFFNGKVMSIGIYYINKQDSYMSLDHETDLAYTFKDIKNGAVALENVSNYPTLDSTIKAHHQFVVVHNRTIKEETDYADDLLKSGVEVWYGAHEMDLGNLNSYLGTNLLGVPHQHWGFGFYMYSEQNFYIDYSFHFYNANKSNSGDSVNVAYDGWSGFVNMGCDLTKTSVLDIVPMVGIGYQNMQIEINENNFNGYTGVNGISYTIKNPAFMLNGRLDLRLKLVTGLTLVAKGGYMLDVSNDNWKYNKESIDATNKFDGFYWRAGIAFGSN